MRVAPETTDHRENEMSTKQTTEPRWAWGEYVPGIGWMAATAYGRSGSYETEAEALREAEARAAREDRMRERATGSAA